MAFSWLINGGDPNHLLTEMNLQVWIMGSQVTGGLEIQKKPAKNRLRILHMRLQGYQNSLTFIFHVNKSLEIYHDIVDVPSIVSKYILGKT